MENGTACMTNGSAPHTSRFHSDPAEIDGSQCPSERSAEEVLFFSGSQGNNKDGGFANEVRRSLNLRQSFQNEGGEDAAVFAPGVFLDVAAMKDRVRDALKKPTYNVQDYYCERGIWQRIAKSALFEQITLGVIAFNAIWIAVDTDQNDAEILMEAEPVFQITENVFCTFFTFELLSRFMAFKRKRNCLRDTWFIFDAVLVFMMIVETWVMSLVVVLSEGGGSGGFGNASVLRIARLLRLSRMARMVRLLRIMPELMIMIKGMMAAIRSVFFTLLLLVIIMYVFGIAFTQLCAGTEVGGKYYGSVPESMYTLLIYGTFLDEIGLLTREMGEESMVMTGVFLAFVLLAALTVMNMLIGVLCEVVSAVAATEKEEMLITWVKSKIEKIFEEVDTDGSKTVTRKEFVSILENALACRALQDVGVDVVGLVDFADAIFEDEGAAERELTFAEFMDVVLQLRGCNNATVRDIVDLRKLVQKVGAQTTCALHQMERISKVVHDTSSRVSAVSGATARRGSRESNKSDFCRSDLMASISSADKVSNGLSGSPGKSPGKFSNVSAGFVPESDGEPPKAPESTEPWSNVEYLKAQLAIDGVSQITWEPLASPLKLSSTPQSIEVCQDAKAETTPGSSVHKSSELGRGVVCNAELHVCSQNPIDKSHDPKAKEWHHRVDSDGFQFQIERLDDALDALASIRTSLAGCAMLDFKLDAARLDRLI